MILERQAIPDVVVVNCVVHRDARGDFSETFRAERLAEAGLDRPIVQENLVRTAKAGMLRGLHFQKAPFAQEKLIQVIAGTIFDVVVDLRPGSPTLGRWLGLELSAGEARHLFVPQGFAHGYLTLTDDCAVLYKTGAYYAPQAERGLRWDDPAIGVEWPLPAAAISTNERDAGWPPFAAVMEELAA